MEVRVATQWLSIDTERLFTVGHTSRPTDFCWAPGEGENWTGASVSEDNVVMVWQPTMRIWAGDEVKIRENELEGDAMEGVELATGDKGKASGSTRSQSIGISAESTDE